MPEDKPVFTSLEEATAKYKDLQRELEKSRKREKEAVTQRMDWDEMQEVNRLNARMLQTILEGGEVSGTNEEKPIQDLVAEVKGSMGLNQSRKQMAQALVEAGLDYSDLPKETQTLYESGKVAEALSAVLAGNKGTIEDRVAAEVQRVLKDKGKVDDGASSGTGGIPTDPKTLNERLSDPVWRKANRAKLMEMARDGVIKVR